MRINIIEINPIEMLRIAEKLSQKKFAEKLGYRSKDQYSYHSKEFTKDIIVRVYNIYGIDIVPDIISFLKNEVKSLKRNNNTSKKPINQANNFSDISNLIK